MDKLYFYSKSRDVAPGKGTNEIVNDPSLYADLAKIKDWRKVLSNFHVCPFVYEGNTYKTIEHVFQAKKIEIVDKEKAYQFTVESGNTIGQGDGELARKNRKLVKLSDEQLKLWGTMKDKVMHNAAVEKYKTCKEAMAVLKATNNAQLWHIVSRSQPIRFEHLEKIRDENNAKVEPVKLKECKEGKIRDPNTGRCISLKTAQKRAIIIASENNKPKECKEGKIRDPNTGRCISLKTAQKRAIIKASENNKPKECKEGKIRDPNTGRCISLKTAQKRGLVQ